MISNTSYPKISVVTPNYNQGDFLEQTILSVLEQNYPNLEYIIIDGGSTDSSLDIINKYCKKLHYWVTEPDKGMYDAINKGFLNSSGKIMCWINSDDVLWEGSLHYIAEKFTENKSVHWLQGLPSVIDENGQLILQRNHVYSPWFFYLKKYEEHFSFIQQESTFWSRELWIKSGANLNLKYKLAADFDLWMRFFQYEPLYCCKKQLAAFRIREGQKSSDKNGYLKEAEESLKSNFKNIGILQKMNFYLGNSITRFLNKLPWQFMKSLKKKWIKKIIGPPNWVD